MKSSNLIVLCLSLACASFSFADQVVRETTDNTAGAAVGSLSGLMLGGAAGGPVGALVGAGAGFFAGRAVQQETGLSEPAYEVENQAGEREVIRSPNARFALGQRVERQGIRIQAVAD